MLILQRKVGEEFVIGDDVSISVVSIEGNRVRLAISAPREVAILRKELLDAEEANRDAAAEMAPPAELLNLLGNQGMLDKKSAAHLKHK